MLRCGLTKLTGIALAAIPANVIMGFIEGIRATFKRQRECIDADMARDHRKLDVFKIADDLAVLMYRKTADFPSSERFGLQSQLRRAAVSIAANIAEGCARESERDFLRFLDIVFGSAREVIYLTGLAQRLEFMEPAAAA